MQVDTGIKGIPQKEKLYINVLGIKSGQVGHAGYSNFLSLIRYTIALYAFAL